MDGFSFPLRYATSLNTRAPLAEELGAAQLIIDEVRGRRVAQHRNLPVTGTLGVLKAAAQEGLLDLKTAVARLRLTSFHVAQAVLDFLLDDPE
jgi:predicted nucleic acid-binding protein